MNVICFRHPEYQGTTTPVLSCKTCCSLFIAAIKAKTPVKVDADMWLKEKSREAVATREEGTAKRASYGFDPRSV